MHKGRLEAFSDGVLAIIITIMALELKVPHGSALADLAPIAPTFLSYVLSFTYVGIYWNNHHHLFQTVQNVSGKILWANIHLLFWLSLTPFVTAWSGHTHFASIPVASYGFVLLMAAISYYILTRSILQLHGRNSLLAKAIGKDRKGKLSVIIYATAIPLAFVKPVYAVILYALLAAVWIIPDARIERTLSQQPGSINKHF